MDKSETYIKMRLAARPDLGMGVPMGFSIIWQSESILIDEKGDCYYSTEYAAVQLERQDQLQAIYLATRDYKDSRNAVIVMLDEFREWMFEDCTGLDWAHKVNLNVSAEQLWIAFDMLKLHNKIWDGEKWIK